MREFKKPVNFLPIIITDSCCYYLSMKDTFVTKSNELIADGDRFIRQNGIGKFHLEAKRLLHAYRLHEIFDFDKLVKLSFTKKIPSDQNFKFLEFSDLPITIARGKNCFLDVYFWRRRPTTVHNHHFVGAFQCIIGNNVDCSYSFTPTTKLTKFHSEGKLELKRELLLKSGDVESISLQDKFIHQNHHQCDLTVNFAFRTPDIPMKNLSNFYYSGIKFEKSQSSLIRAERLISFASLGKVDLDKIDYNLEDAFNFVLQTHNSHLHPKVLEIRKVMMAKIKAETSLDLTEKLDMHERELDRMIGLYE